MERTVREYNIKLIKLIRRTTVTTPAGISTTTETVLETIIENDEICRLPLTILLKLLKLNLSKGSRILVEEQIKRLMNSCTDKIKSHQIDNNSFTNEENVSKCQSENQDRVLNFDPSVDKTVVTTAKIWREPKFLDLFGCYIYILNKGGSKSYICPLCRFRDTCKALLKHLNDCHSWGSTNCTQEDLCPRCHVPIPKSKRHIHQRYCYLRDFHEALQLICTAIDEHNFFFVWDLLNFEFSTY